MSESNSGGYSRGEGMAFFWRGNGYTQPCGPVSILEHLLTRCCFRVTTNYQSNSTKYERWRRSHLPDCIRHGFHRFTCDHARVQVQTCFFVPYRDHTFYGCDYCTTCLYL